MAAVERDTDPRTGVFGRTAAGLPDRPRPETPAGIQEGLARRSVETAPTLLRQEDSPRLEGGPGNQALKRLLVAPKTPLFVAGFLHHQTVQLPCFRQTTNPRP